MKELHSAYKKFKKYQLGQGKCEKATWETVHGQEEEDLSRLGPNLECQCSVHTCGSAVYYRHPIKPPTVEKMTLPALEELGNQGQECKSSQ